MTDVGFLGDLGGPAEDEAVAGMCWGVGALVGVYSALQVAGAQHAMSCEANGKSNAPMQRIHANQNERICVICVGRRRTGLLDSAKCKKQQNYASKYDGQTARPDHVGR